MVQYLTDLIRQTGGQPTVTVNGVSTQLLAADTAGIVVVNPSGGVTYYPWALVTSLTSSSV